MYLRRIYKSLYQTVTSQLGGGVKVGGVLVAPWTVPIRQGRQNTSLPYNPSGVGVNVFSSD